MRHLLQLSLALGVVLAVSFPALAQNEVQAILEKAEKAHGGREKLDKIKALQSKAKGNLEILGGLSFTEETSVQFPDKFKEVIHLEIMGQKITQTVGFDGSKGWISHNGMNIDVEEKILEELKEAAYALQLGRLTGLKDKGFELSLVGETKVNNRPAVGVKVASKGHRDINIYFDKETGLTAKTERRAFDAMSMQEVAEEKIILEYQDVEGQKTAKNVLINRDGKKFMEMEVTEVKFLDKIADSEFAKP
jgi:hypothetical protein